MDQLQNNEATARYNAFFCEIYQPTLTKYVEALEQLATLYIRQQKALIEANLFATEGYTNYSAPYHTINTKWLPVEEDGAISELKIERRHVVMCSVLQQIGLRLLRAKQYRDLGMSEVEIAYRVADYEHRIADMFFGDSQWFGDNINEPRADYVLLRLKSGGVNKHRFSPEFYSLLNLGTDLVKSIKKNRDIAIEKQAELAELLCLRKYLLAQGNITPEVENSQLKELLPADRAALNVWLKSFEDSFLVAAAQQIINKTFIAKLEAASQEIPKNKPVALWGYRFFSVGPQLQLQQQEEDTAVRQTLS